jgi:uncharacterized protein with GYD domain
MSKYMFRFSYDSSGAQAVIDNGGSSRVAMADQLAERLGGSVEAFYFAFGAHDAVVIADLPDNEAAAAVALTVATGNISIETTPLLTAEQVDAAGQRLATGG